MKFRHVFFTFFLISLPSFSLQEEYVFREIEVLDGEEVQADLPPSPFRFFAKEPSPYSSFQNQRLSLQEIRDNASGKLVSQSQAEYHISDSVGLRWAGKAIESPKEVDSQYSSSFLLSYQLHEDEESELNFLSGISYESFRSKEKLEKEEEKKEGFRNAVTPVFKTGLEFKF